jgi:tetratricopeptide (TPR) repeat protein
MRSSHVRQALFMVVLAALASHSDVLVAAEPSVPLYEVGSLSRAITTASPEAQKYFDQGLAFMFGFNHDEAIRSFQRAAELDPGCAMAHWGVALANGPHINNPVLPANRAKAAWEALVRAQAAAAGASPIEKALIVAVAARYASPPQEDRKALDLAYANAMRSVWAAYPKDADVGALFAEAMMDLRPWDLWLPDGTPQPGTEELIRALDAVRTLDPGHPLALHLYIHAVEAREPARADKAADALRERLPGLGHLVHMPSHIDVRRGRWQEAIVANTKAIDADARYTARSGEQGFYRLYMAHNHHMLTYAGMMSGQSAIALQRIREMVKDIPLEFFRANAWADGFMAMPLEVLMRFGRWQEILAEPGFPDYVPISRALQHYARGVAFAATSRMPEAEKELAAFFEARQKVAKEATFGNNSGSDVLGVAERVLKGELAFRAGRRDEGIALLREGVTLEDKLRYNEPPDWIQPVRHPLGAALLAAGRFAEAEAVFREDLAKLPDNGWGLYGLQRALALQKKKAEAAEVQKRFDTIWSKADVKIQSACLCLPGV